MSRLFPTFRKYVADNCLLREGDRAVVSVSGGIDSMVLLDLLVRLSGSMGLELVVAHANHGLRGRESDGDEGLVRQVAERRGIEFVSRRLKPREGSNIQDAARSLRQDFLKRLAGETDADVVCLGHNRGDQAETIIMHLMRGAGLAGLRGMSPASRMDGIRVARPIMFASRGEIEAYAKQRGVDFREDSTNARTDYRRNEIRHLVMPRLSEINPKIEEKLCAMGERFAEDEEALTAIAGELFDECLLKSAADSVSISRREYAEMPPAIRRRMLRIMYSTLAGSSADLNSDQVERMDGISLSTRKAGEYRLKAPWRFARSGETLMIARAEPRPGSARPNTRKRR
jgi:tRNA(Ile)-lysidine synthase